MLKKEVLVGKILASGNRSKVLLSLAESSGMPTHLEKRTGIKFSHISDVLKELVELKLVVCTTPNLRKGKIYAITGLGKQTVEKVKAFSADV